MGNRNVIEINSLKKEIKKIIKEKRELRKERKNIKNKNDWKKWKSTYNTYSLEIKNLLYKHKALKIKIYCLENNLNPIKFFTDST